MKTVLMKDKEIKDEEEVKNEKTDILEEIEVEDLAVDGICGVY